MYEIFAATNNNNSLELGALGIVIAIIIAILPYVAILVIWANTSNIDKNLDKILSLLKEQEKQRNIANEVATKLKSSSEKQNQGDEN